MVLHLDVGKGTKSSLKALEQAMVDDSLILLATQHQVHIEEPAPDDVLQMGTIARVRQMLKLNGTIRVLVEGLHRARISEFVKTDPFYEVKTKEVFEEETDDLDTQALMRSVLDHFEQYLRLSKKVSAETYSAVADIDEAGRLADVIASHLPLKISDKQRILETIEAKKRLENPVGND